MGTYLNPGCEKYRMAVNSCIYVDKTEMIAYLNSIVCTEQRFVSVSGPRRFGKSIAVNMLAAYYGRGESRELFCTFQMSEHENWDRYLNHFDVIKVVMTDFIKETKEVSASLAKMTDRILDDLAEAYPDVKYDSEDLAYSMDRFCRKTGVPFVIIINEWDAVFRVKKNDC